MARPKKLLTITHIQAESGVNWSHPDLLATENSAGDVGVITKKALEPGTLLVVYGGIPLDQANIAPLNKAMRQYFYQLSPSIWYGPGANSATLGIGERFNHSCRPNAGFVDAVTIVTLEEVKAGEEITVDYAKFQSSELEGSSFECSCGCEGCRLEVRVDDWSRIEPASKEYRYCQPYIQGLIQPHGSLAASLYSSLRFPNSWHSPWLGKEYAQPFLTSEAVDVQEENRTVRAARRIHKDEVLFVGGGQVVASDEIATIDQHLRPFFVRLREGFLIGPRHVRDLGGIHYLTQSSDAANVDRILGVFVKARREIEPGELLCR